MLRPITSYASTRGPASAQAARPSSAPSLRPLRTTSSAFAGSTPFSGSNVTRRHLGDERSSLRLAAAGERATLLSADRSPCTHAPAFHALRQLLSPDSTPLPSAAGDAALAGGQPGADGSADSGAMPAPKPFVRRFDVNRLTAPMTWGYMLVYLTGMLLVPIVASVAAGPAVCPTGPPPSRRGCWRRRRRKQLKPGRGHRRQWPAWC